MEGVGTVRTLRPDRKTEKDGVRGVRRKTFIELNGEGAFSLFARRGGNEVLLKRLKEVCVSGLVQRVRSRERRPLLRGDRGSAVIAKRRGRGRC